jgi:hypothetical protein
MHTNIHLKVESTVVFPSLLAWVEASVSAVAWWMFVPWHDLFFSFTYFSREDRWQRKIAEKVRRPVVSIREPPD